VSTLIWPALDRPCATAAAAPGPAAEIGATAEARAAEAGAADSMSTAAGAASSVSARFVLDLRNPVSSRQPALTVANMDILGDEDGP
jgi:hypothetical protein